MRLLFVSLPLFAVALACTNCNGRQTLQTDRDTMVGVWAKMQSCPRGMYPNGMQILYQPNRGPTQDNTALNGVRLFCNYPTSTVCSTNYPITSGIGAFGSWQNVQWCPNGQSLIGFSFRQTDYSSKIDNTGVTNFAGYCGTPFGERSASRRIEGNTDKWGFWSEDKFCPVGYVMCGFQSRIAARVVKGDNQGMTNINVDCCEVDDIPCTPGHQILILTKMDNSQGKKAATLSYEVKSSFSITSEFRKPSNTENKIISQKLATAIEVLAYRINTEIGQQGEHVTASSLNSMLQDAMGHGSSRTLHVQVPKKTQAFVKQVYLTCGAYRVALAHVIEEGTKKPGNGGNDHDHGDSEDDCKKVATLSYDVKTSFTITEYRKPSNTETKIISQKLVSNIEMLTYRISNEIGQHGNHITASSLNAMLQDAINYGSSRSVTAQVPKKTLAFVKQVYLTCGAYRIALAHVIEEGTKKPGNGGKEHDHGDSEKDC